MKVSKEPVGAGHLLNKVASVFVALALLMMPLIVNTCGQNTVCDEFGTRSFPVSEEEEVKHACTVGFQLLTEPKTPGADDQGPIPSDDRIEAALHGEVAVPPPKFRA